MVSSISIIIPVYNGSLTLPDLISQLEITLPSLAPRYEAILVNDASRDHSWETICSLAERYSWVHGINLMKNYGQHNALLCGIRAAIYDTLVTIDDDLQHPPDEIQRLLDRLNEGYDVVYGTPKTEQHGIWRDTASQVTKLALRSAMGVETAAKVSAFRAFKTNLRDAFASYLGPYVSIDVLLTWGTSKFSSVEVRHDSRRYGQSNYTFRKLVAHALNMMTGFSTLPLRFASLIGFLFTLFGMVILVYVIGRYLIQGGSVPGFPFLASIIALFSGAQLFALGIIGEYLARIHFRMMDKPAYTVREQTKL
ncbi:MAG: glycosyl transferase [Chloroflexi bacterium RBG_13_48_10]|nr:MAG: glycosyl transferase [Chloroflexi bacterium RBG_13_48_10]